MGEELSKQEPNPLHIDLTIDYYLTFKRWSDSLGPKSPEATAAHKEYKESYEACTSEERSIINDRIVELVYPDLAAQRQPLPEQSNIGTEHPDIVNLSNLVDEHLSQTKKED